MLAAGLLLAAAAHAQPIELDGIELSQDVPCLGGAPASPVMPTRSALPGTVVWCRSGTGHEISRKGFRAGSVGHRKQRNGESVDRLTVDTSKNHIRTTILGRGQTAIVECQAPSGLELAFDGGAGHPGWHRQPLAVER